MFGAETNGNSGEAVLLSPRRELGRTLVENLCFLRYLLFKSVFASLREILMALRSITAIQSAIFGL
jgi:hypothetical protein